MGHFFDTPTDTGRLLLLLGALFIACGFEFVNGFHDTANAVATVIYTHSLKPHWAVAWSGFCNFLGVYLGGIAVAMSIIKLLPVELLASSGSGAGLAMVLALLIAAILWNLGTWYLGLPASSSHTLIGAIVGVGLANSLMPGHVFGSGVNWHKVREIGLSLVFSPIIGFGAAALLLLASKKLLRSPELHTPPDGKTAPPGWIRGLLVTTCSGVSFAHGSNDGQKGVGLIMLILIGLLPADFALDTSFHKAEIDETVAITRRIDTITRESLGPNQALAPGVDVGGANPAASQVLSDLADIRAALTGKDDVKSIPADERFAMRTKIMRVDTTLGELAKQGKIPADQAAPLEKERKALRGIVDYAPKWVMVLVALSLGLGTMIGWKRIVVTVGEKIGKAHLTYAQGASAELVAMTTIGLSGAFGLPVSTTHVLSSGIAGTMVAQKAGLQKSTVRNIALAWILTLPVSIVLSALLFLLFRSVIPNASAATASVKFVDPSSEESSIVVPVLGKPLRLQGSNTLGAELAPAMAEGFLRHEGGADVMREANAGGHAFRVSAHLPGETQPVTVEIDAEGSATAFSGLVDGNADIGMSSRPATTDEVEHAAKAGLGDITANGNENVIGLDGVAVIVNPNNPTHSLAIAQVARIFTGATATWAGGGPIDVLARDDRSGTFDTFKSVVLGDQALARGARRFSDNETLVAAVVSDEGAIGFVPMAQARGVKAVALSDTGSAALAPTPFSVATEDYPLTRRLYLYTAASSTHPLTREFVQFALSPEGQKVVTAFGFVDLSAKKDQAAVDTSCEGCPPGYAELTRGAQRLSMSFRFRSGGTELDSRASADVKRLAAVLSSRRNPQLLLLGFSDAAGPADQNLALSRARAAKVAAALDMEEVHPAVVQGFGDTMPRASDATVAGRERNRRVEAWVR